MSFILTRFGHKFNFDTLDINEIDINDIAWSLSNICRFNGHTKFFYSVLEHSLNVYDTLVLEYSYSNIDTQLGVLLHDAAECYLNDIPRPFKKELKYNNFTCEGFEEKILFEKIFKKFNIEISFTEWELIKFVDSKIFISEIEQLFNFDWELKKDIISYKHLIIKKSESKEWVRKEFLRLFSQLINKKNV